jgi:hypothetical protein
MIDLASDLKERFDWAMYHISAKRLTLCCLMENPLSDQMRTNV